VRETTENNKRGLKEIDRAGAQSHLVLPGIRPPLRTKIRLRLRESTRQRHLFSPLHGKGTSSARSRDSVAINLRTLLAQLTARRRRGGGEGAEPGGLLSAKK